MRRISCWIGIAVAAGGSLFAAKPQSPSSPDSAASESYRTVLDRYCVTCHNEKLKTAGLVLDQMDVQRVSDGAPVWEKVVRKLRTGAMPPAGLPRPDQATYDSFATYLETALDSAAMAKPNPGSPTAHRLNRAEYTNAVRDLLAVEIDGQSILPADDSGYGFDNVADTLSVSPTLLERYLTAAGKISRLAVGDPAAGPTTQTYDVLKYLRQDDRVSEDLPFGSRGGLAIRHHFPLDGEYVMRIHLRTNNRGYFYGLNEGLDEPHQLEAYVDGKRIKVFSVGGERKGKTRTVNNSAADEEDPEIMKYEESADEGLEMRFPVKAGTRMVAVSFVQPEEPEGILRPLSLIDVLSSSPTRPIIRMAIPRYRTSRLAGLSTPKG
jgi:mono/diheme cytochrome c family protein